MMKKLLKPLQHLFLLAALLVSGYANAITLDSAKAQGLVGERLNGYLGVASSQAGNDVKTLVSDINNKRKALYHKKAEQTGVESSVFELRMGERLQNMTPSGQYIQDKSGQWIKK